MSIKEEMTNLMNAVRSVTGDADKLSVSQATISLDAASIFVDYGVISSGSMDDLAVTLPRLEVAA